MLKPVRPYLQRRKQRRTIHLCPEDCGRQCLAGSASRQKPLAKPSMAATAKVDSFVGDPHPALPYPSTCGVETSKARSGVARSAGWGRSSHEEAAPTRHIVRSAHDVSALPTKGEGMECAAAFPHISPISSRKTNTPARSRRARRASFADMKRFLKHQRAQGMPGARCARSLACKIKKAYELVTTG